jgi:hypothetical protein
MNWTWHEKWLLYNGYARAAVLVRMARLGKEKSWE